MKINFAKNNNLEWLRHIFAMQVVLLHAEDHFKIVMPAFIDYLPGVPAFFFISGFLIYASYINSPGRHYFENRFLRLFPGLFFVTFGGAAAMVIGLGWTDFIENISIYIVWFISQVTLGQAYNPSHFRGVGVGVVNGALWTITVEIIFYLFIPLIVWLERRFRFVVITLFILSFLIYAIGPMIWHAPIYRDKTFFDFLALTPIVWGWMFFLGILVVKHWHWFQPRLKYFPLALVPMIAIAILADKGIFFGAAGNRLGLIYLIFYILLILWLAFATPFVPLKFDLSYGVYIWHMPILNVLLIFNMPDIFILIIVTFIAATLSWIYVERPALKLKRKSLINS
jgi:peptidoglycan/LPS O-acetylase OafA/YrhL